jgi:hypothetical protein
MHSLRKFLSETCITSLYYYCRFWHKRSQKGNLKKMNFLNFHPILMYFFLQSVHLYELLMDNIFFNYLISKGGLKGFQIPHFAYLKGKWIFIFILILTWFCCCWKNCIVRFPLSFTVSEINFIDRDRKVQISIKMCYFIPKRTQIPKFCIFDNIEFLFLSNFDVFVLFVEWIVLSAFDNMSTVPPVFYWTTPIFFIMKSYFK